MDKGNGATGVHSWFFKAVFDFEEIPNRANVTYGQGKARCAMILCSSAVSLCFCITAFDYSWDLDESSTGESR